MPEDVVTKTHDFAARRCEAALPAVRAPTSAPRPLVRALPRLRLLTLNGTGISDAGLSQITCLADLTYLDLSESQVTDAGLNVLVTDADHEPVTPGGRER